MRVGWFREYEVEILRRSRDRLQLLGDSDREIREEHILVLGGGEVRAGTCMTRKRFSFRKQGSNK